MGKPSIHSSLDINIMYKYIVILLFTGLWYPVSQAETLFELYQQAEQQNTTLQIAHSELRIALERKPQAQAQLAPQLHLDTQATENLYQKDWLTSDRFENTIIGYDIALSYPLYRRDRQIALTQSDTYITQAQMRYENARQTLVENLASSYFTALAAQDNLAFAGAAKEAFQRQLEQAQQRFEVGLIAITDVQEAQAGFDLAVAEEIQAQNELDNARESLREITGSYYQTLAILSDKITLTPPKPNDIDAWTQLALERNPQLLAAHRAVDIARQEIELQRAANLPTVDLVGRHGYSDALRGDELLGNSLATQSSVGIQLSYSLYEGGAIRSRVREAQQRYTQTLEQLEQQRRAIQQQTHSAFLNVSSNVSRTKALKQALTSTETALEAVQVGFEVGTRTTVDVLNAQRDLLKAQRDYARARYDYVLNMLRLKQAAGVLNAEDLTKIN